jgi:predicted dehydrogenase
MKELNIGLVGTGFMGKGHSTAYKLLPHIFSTLPARPRLRIVGDVNEELAKTAAANFGFEDYSVGWEHVVNHPEVDIVDITAPNHVHKEIAVAAAKAGKHIYCEKPLAVTLEDARDMMEAAQTAGVKTLVGFNYLKSPATLMAKRLIDEGKIGDIWHFKGYFNQDVLADPSLPFSWRFEKKIAGSGALGDLGAHIIAIAHLLVGDICKLCAMTETFIRERSIATGAFGYDGKADLNAPRKTVENDDVVNMLFKFKCGATGTIESSRIAQGHKVFLTYEINGSKGSLRFNHERMNELEVYFSEDPEGIRGFRNIISGPEHPYYSAFWPVAGCGLGFGDMKVIEIYELLNGIANDKAISPDFRDGYKVNQVIAATLESAEQEKWINVG